MPQRFGCQYSNLSCDHFFSHIDPLRPSLVVVVKRLGAFKLDDRNSAYFVHEMMLKSHK